MKDELKRQMLMMLESKLNGLISRFTTEGEKLDDPEKEAEIMKLMTNNLSKLIRDFEKFYKIKDHHAHLFEEDEKKWVEKLAKERIEIKSINKEGQEKLCDQDVVDIEFFGEVLAGNRSSIHRCKKLIIEYEKMRGREVKLADLTTYHCIDAALKTLSTIKIPSSRDEHL